MRYLCTNCNYVYDESIWDEWEWIEAGTIFDNLGEDFICPVCNEDKDNFYIIEEEVNYIKEEKYKDYLMLEHFPEVKINEDKIIVSIWKDLHPMWEDHRISSVLLYDEYGDLVEEIFLDIDEEPIVEFDYFWDEEFEIRVRCSLHWLWGIKIYNG